MRNTALALAALLCTLPTAHAQEEFRFTGQIPEWASLFNFLQTPEAVENNPPLPVYIGTLVLGELNDDWAFNFEIQSPPSFSFVNGVDPSLLSPNPLISTNTVFNDELSLQVNLVHVPSLDSGERNLLNFNLDKQTGTGQWEWARIRNSSPAEEVDPFASGTITRFATVPLDRPGDFNNSGPVTGADYTTLRDNLGQLYREDDIAQLQANFGAGGALTTLSEPRPVPEPAAVLLAIAGLIFAPRAAYRG